MKKTGVLFRRLAVVIPITAVSLGLILAIGVRSSNSPRRSTQKLTQEEVSEALKSGTIKVENLLIGNHTKSFRLLGSELSRDQEGVSLRLQNGYHKKITAFQLSIGIVKIKRELIYDESYCINPDQVITLENEAEPELDTRGIEILAVVFDDGTADGTENAIKDIREYRSGMRIAITEALPKMQNALRSHRETLASAIEKTSSEISALPETPESSLPYNTRVGIHDQRWRIGQELQMVSEDRLPAHASLSLEKRQELRHTGLSRIVDTYRRIIAVL